VFSIEWSNLQSREVDIVEAADIYGPFARIEARASEGMDSAMPAKVMLSRHGVELVQRKLAFARNDAEVLVRRAMPQRASAPA